MSNITKKWLILCNDCIFYSVNPCHSYREGAELVSPHHFARMSVTYSRVTTHICSLVWKGSFSPSLEKGPCFLRVVLEGWGQGEARAGGNLGAGLLSPLLLWSWRDGGRAAASLWEAALWQSSPHQASYTPALSRGCSQESSTVCGEDRRCNLVYS